jgi:hypothetical protein
MTDKVGIGNLAPFIAKYRWLPAEDIVLILAVRHQLEAGYAGEWKESGASAPHR